MSALDELKATHAPLHELTATWQDGGQISFDELRALHDRAVVAAHRHYCETIASYRTLASDLALTECRDADVIRAELSSTDDAFKSYDDAWIDAGDYTAMTDWLRSVCSTPITIDPTSITTIQEWLDALEAAGLKLWFSSGTSGHLSFVPRDELAARSLDRQIASLMGRVLRGPAAAARFDAVLMSFKGGRQGLASAADKVASVTNRQTFLYDFAITPDGVRAAAKGDPAAAADFRRRTVDELPERYEAILQALRRSAVDGRPALMLGAPFQVADICQRLEQTGERLSLDPGSLMFLAGGWKSFAGVQLSQPELLALVADRLGITRVLESYGMTECSTQMPMCEHGRFHVPPTLWPMVVDEALRPIDGHGRGRFGFSDPFATCFPGPFITGDEVELTLEPCACGLSGFSLVGGIRRLPGREVKGCGGVMASVRG
ncbi:MAG: hypothetical protein JWO02_1715 [Solirubrobacterales bacterium]|nr:hypothetical protein [Solirubrobacterales bacterium]